VTASPTAEGATGLPPKLAELVDDFAAVGPADRLQLLLELSRELPPLPEAYAGHRDAMEQVHECQTPLFLAVEVDGGTVRLVFDAPAEAPTTRGFAGILYEGLDGEPVDTVLAVPDDFYVRLGLAEAVSPLRLRGMAAMLARIKRQLRTRAA
jgi:cysteine desulfuration protein SufE